MRDMTSTEEVETNMWFCLFLQLTKRNQSAIPQRPSSLFKIFVFFSGTEYNRSRRMRDVGGSVQPSKALLNAAT